MAAQENNKSRLCPRCFAWAPQDSGFCPECGVQFGGETPTEGSDAVVYQDLARANLMRIRGDYAQAEKTLLSVLHRYPNNVTSHTLLGDMFAEQGDCKSATQWYEMALDLEPADELVQGKLRACQQKLKDQESQTTAEKLALPNARRQALTYVVGLLAVVVVVATMSFVVGRTAGDAARQSELLATSPVDVTPPQPEDVPAPALPITEETPAFEGTQEEVALRQSLGALSDLSGRALVVQLDPRRASASVGIEARADDDVARLAFRVAWSALKLRPQLAVASVHVLQRGQAVLVADLTAENARDLELALTTEEDWARVDPALVLQNVWTPETAAAAAPAVQPGAEVQPDPGVQPGETATPSGP